MLEFCRETEPIGDIYTQIYNIYLSIFYMHAYVIDIYV
jgi:hypothetical protein